ncbi:TetR/AcrR family transcriptional regulator [Rouxiella sp. WC2420]|uniref:TetR/AcrR family transcriptional regulator n=1 Tax=Rouxiella sp. WC2420 TaxID=3234145 RepID=A0AB39VX59_9GAMM
MKKNLGRPREFDPNDFLDIALDCFWTKGYQTTSISDLMKASGLASASIYKLYPDKRSIFFAALSQYMEQGLGRLRTRAQKKSPEAALRETLEYGALLSTGAEGERGCFTIAAASELLPGDDEVKVKVRNKFNEIKENLLNILLLGQQMKIFRTDIEAAVMAETIFMMLEGMRVYGKVSPDYQSLVKANEFIIGSVMATHTAEDREL